MQEEKYLELLRKYAEYLRFNSIIGDTLNHLSYIILKFLHSLANYCYSAYSGLLDFTSFINSKQVNDLYSYLKPIATVFFFFSLIYIGYRFMLNKKDEKMDILSNFILALSLLVVLPMSMSILNSVTRLSFESIDSFDTKFNSEESSPVDKVFKTLFIDIQKLNDENFEKNIDFDKPNNLTAKDLRNLRINKLIENPKEPLNYVLNGFRTEEAPKNHWYSIANHGYYAWNMLFWQGSAMLLIIAYVYFLCAFKQGASIYNIAVAKIISPLILFSDIHSGQRQKALIKEIINAYVMLIGAYLLVLIYSYFMIFVINSKANFILKIILLYSGGVATANAGIYERILGVEGLGGRGFNPLQAMYQLSFISRSLPKFRGNKGSSSNANNKTSNNENYANNNSSSNSNYNGKDNLNSSSENDKNNNSNNYKSTDNLEKNNSSNKNGSNNYSGTNNNATNKTTEKTNMNYSREHTKNSDLSNNNSDNLHSGYKETNTNFNNDNLRN